MNAHRRSWMFTFFAVFCVVNGLWSQKIEATVNKTKLAVGEVLQVTFFIENIGGNFTPPSFEGFNVVGNFSSTKIINGRRSNEFQFSVIPIKTGKITIGPGKIGNYSSNPITIEVVKGATGSSAAAPQVNASKSNADDIFLLTTLNRKKVYEGEPITVTVLLYSQYNNVSIQEIKFPELSGGWIQDVKQAIDNSFRYEVYNNKRYNAATLKKSILIPQKSGILNFNGVTSKFLVQKVTPSNDPWENMLYGGRVEEVTLSLKSKPLDIEVLPLPDGKPESFKNAVGIFDVNVSLDKTQVKSNDAATLRIKITGRGNLPLIQQPDIQFPSVFEVYDPQISEKTDVSESGVSGYKQFDFLIIPRSGGKFVIPPVSFSFFNPETKQYQTIFSDSLRLNVEGEVVTNTEITAGADASLLNQDIRYIHEKPYAVFNSNALFYRSVWFYVLLSVSAFATTLIIGFRKVWFGRTVDLDDLKTKRAKQLATQRLKKANGLLDNQDSKLYYAEIQESLNSYLNEKFKIQKADLSREFLRSFFEQKKLDAALMDAFFDIIQICELARFAPPGSLIQKTELYQRALDWIIQIEKSGK